MRRLAVALAALAVAAAAPDFARACSCVGLDPETALAERDAAFVGSLVEKRVDRPVLSTGEDAVYVFRVDRVLKGSLTRTIEVESAVSGASCGIEAERGTPVGLFLERDHERWRSNLCLQADARELRAFAEREGVVLRPPRPGSDATARDDARGRRVAILGLAGVLVALGVLALRRYFRTGSSL